MQIDIGEVVTIICVTGITITAILALEGGGTEIVAAGVGGLVGYLTKSNNGGMNDAEEEAIHVPVSGTITGGDNVRIDA